MRRTDDDVACIACDIIDPIRDGFAQRILEKVGCQDLQRLLPPGRTRVFERAHQLFLFRIDANDGQTGTVELASQAGDVAHLPIALWILPATQALAIDAQGITFEAQEAGNRRATDFEFPTQLARQLTDGLACPLETCNRIASRRIGEQFI